MALHLARLREPVRFHLELTAPGVSGGQVLPHNGDRSLVVSWSNGALRAVRPEERERRKKRKKIDRRDAYDQPFSIQSWSVLDLEKRSPDFVISANATARGYCFLP